MQDHSRTEVLDFSRWGFSIEVQGLSPRQIRRMQARCTYLDERGRPKLDVHLFECEQFRLGVVWPEGGAPDQREMAQLTFHLSAATWDVVIDAIDELSGFRTPRPSPAKTGMATVDSMMKTARMVLPHVAKVRHYTPKLVTMPAPAPCEGRTRQRPRARRTAASSSTSSADPPPDDDSDSPRPRLCLVPDPPPRPTLYTYAVLTAEQRGEVAR